MPKLTALPYFTAFILAICHIKYAVTAKLKHKQIIHFNLVLYISKIGIMFYSISCNHCCMNGFACFGFVCKQSVSFAPPSLSFDNSTISSLVSPIRFSPSVITSLIYLPECLNSELKILVNSSFSVPSLLKNKLSTCGK